MQDLSPIFILGVERDSDDFSGDFITKDLGFPVIGEDFEP